MTRVHFRVNNFRELLKFYICNGKIPFFAEMPKTQ